MATCLGVVSWHRSLGEGTLEVTPLALGSWALLVVASAIFPLIYPGGVTSRTLLVLDVYVVFNSLNGLMVVYEICMSLLYDRATFMVTRAPSESIETIWAIHIVDWIVLFQVVLRISGRVLVILFTNSWVIIESVEIWSLDRQLIEEMVDLSVGVPDRFLSR